MIGRVYAIALNTFREAIRQKVLYGILVVVVVVNLFGLVLGAMSLDQEDRISRDIGLGGVQLFGAFTAMYLGVSLLYGEIQRKTIYTIVSKPIERYEFVLGKYAGMAATLTLLVLLFTLAMVGLLWLQDVPFTAALVKALSLAFMEVLIVAAVAVFFSSFSTPFLSGIFTFVVFFLGRVTPEIRSAVESARWSWVRTVCDGVLKIIPDLHVFSVSGSTAEGAHVSIHGGFVTWSYVGTAGGYAGLTIAALLLLSILIFSRRNFV